MKFEVRPLSDVLGAEIIGFDLGAAMNDEDFSELHRAHLEHLVIVFRDQSLSPSQQSLFARRFGPLIEYSLTQAAVPGHPCVTMISTRREKGEFIGVADAGPQWHSDHCYRERPALGTMLFAIEVPDDGGDTSFANLRAAYDALPSDLGRAVEGRKGIFMNSRAQGGKPNAEQRQAMQQHPLVRTHPETGRKSLFVSQQQTVAIEGLPEDEGEEILERLFAHCFQEEFVYVHRWVQGDLTFWDNRCTAHKADLSRINDPKYVRHMHRTMIEGDKPF
ncbi:MAG: taurine dioxygenase [Rhodospirillaceae bacterium]|nr:taurine dioxygenase [Rhodospirillaceae bacterium]HAA92958.1 taurine dioxygenase [Rhodospirillaceae bacterium]